MAGAAFVARSTVYHITQLDQLLGQALAKPGFGVVEVLSPCHTNFGRQNRLGSQIDMMKDFKKRGVRVDRWEKLPADQRQGRYPLGVLVDRELPGFGDSYRGVCNTASRLRQELQS